MNVRVRFAPSPTGHLHIGGARTALFNWLYARHEGGAFILRIEDTDVERSSQEMVDGILESLRWLGLHWDEGPYFQSERVALYQEVCRKLLAGGHAYRCFCTPSLLEQKKEAAQQVGEGWKYDETCRRLSSAEIESRLTAGEPSALRLKVPKREKVAFRDLVFGAIDVDSDTIEDFVIQRSDGMPTYHLSVVADDIDMGVTHVIRGVDHLLNTCKHILIYRGLGRPVPVHGHLPLILGPDKKRLSKRHGATSVMEYKLQGFLPTAVVNYLALLGWSPGNDRELFSEEELIQAFDLGHVNKANAVFDLAKLEWMNAQKLGALPVEKLALQVKPALQDTGLWNPAWEGEQRATLLATLRLIQSRCRRIRDFAEYGRPFLTDRFEYEPDGINKYLSPQDQGQRAGLAQAVQELADVYRRLQPFDLENTERGLRTVAAARGLKGGAFIGAVRVGLTGRTAAPGLFDVIVTLGRERTVRRLERLLRFLQ